MTFKNDVRIYEKIVELHEAFVEAWKAETPDPDFITQCMFQSISTSMSEHSVAKGGNVLGLDREEGNVVMLLYDIAVNGQELEDRAREKLKASGQAMVEFAKSVDGLVDWQYMNYADSYQVCVGTCVEDLMCFLANVCCRILLVAMALRTWQRFARLLPSTTRARFCRSVHLVVSRFPRSKTSPSKEFRDLCEGSLMIRHCFRDLDSLMMAAPVSVL